MNPDDQSNLPQISVPADNSLQASSPSGPVQYSGDAEDQVLPLSDELMTPDMTTLQARVGATPAEANDLDVIEKEWVIQLKNVVSHTAHDPHAQQAEITKIKADYMKKRYNKDIKVTGT